MCIKSVKYNFKYIKHNLTILIHYLNKLKIYLCFFFHIYKILLLTLPVVNVGGWITVTAPLMATYFR